MCGQIQGSTLTFQLTSPVASDSNNLDVTGQNLFFSSHALWLATLLALWLATLLA